MRKRKDIKALFAPKHFCKECGVRIDSGSRCSKCSSLIHEIIKSGGPRSFVLKISGKVKHQPKKKLSPRLAAKWQAKRERIISGENANAKHAKTKEESNMQ